MFTGLQSHEYIQSEYGENCDLFTKYGHDEQNHLANYKGVEGDGVQQKLEWGKRSDNSQEAEEEM